jgi:CDP-diacylglycerol pyrophosphatase
LLKRRIIFDLSLTTKLKKMKINIAINFSDGHTQNYLHVPCVPNVGDALDNPNDRSNFYYVVRRLFYYLDDNSALNIILSAEKKQPCQLL